MHVPFAMDGITWMTAPIAAGASFRYEFEIEQSGTYWYHPHFNTAGQVDSGLYGALVVEAVADPILEELVLLFDVPTEHSENHDHVAQIGGWTVNGLPQPSVSYPGGTRVRVRMINVSNEGYVALSWPGIRQIASDQGLLAVLREPSRIVLAPADRADVELLIGEEGFSIMGGTYTLFGDAAREDEALFEIVVTEPTTTPNGANWPFSGQTPTADPAHTDILYMFQGAPETGEWFINGEQFPNVTVEELALNDVAIIEVRNLSPTEHPFHLHGHGFEVLSVGGEPVADFTFEDNFNIPIRSNIRIRLLADNPGDWMTHCHILAHPAGGMMTVLRINE
jgi:FtsP/CotA-like multicopper oxidase with cupredoxin domain